MDNTVDLFEESSLDDDEIISKFWFDEFDRQFVKKPGEHLFCVGITGSGKTQKGYWLVKQILQYETVLWFDSGKSYSLGKFQEFGPLFTFETPVHIIYPAGDISIKIENSPVPVSYSRCNSPNQLWDLIKPNQINIVSLSRFYIEPELYAKWGQRAFRELILISKNEHSRIDHVLPLAIFHDEFSDVAPGDRISISSSQRKLGRIMAHNIKELRSIGVRIVAFAQAWANVTPAVRQSFNWILACRGLRIEREEPLISHYNRLHGSLQAWQGVLWWPTREFHGIWRFPLYHSPDNMTFKKTGVLESL